MDDRPPAASPLPPPDPLGAQPLRGAALLVGAAVLGAIALVAGYRLYAADREATAAELVRIRAFLEAKAAAETVAKPAPRHASAERPRASPSVASPPGKPQRLAPPSVPAVKTRPAMAKPSRARPTPAPALAKPATPVRRAARPKTLEAIYAERAVRECASGFAGFICRDSLKMDLCREHDAWGRALICPAERPPPFVWPESVG